MPLSVKSGIYAMSKGILENLKLIHKIQPVIKDEHSELKFSENCIFFRKSSTVIASTYLEKKIFSISVNFSLLLSEVIMHFHCNIFIFYF